MEFFVRPVNIIRDSTREKRSTLEFDLEAADAKTNVLL